MLHFKSIIDMFRAWYTFRNRNKCKYWYIENNMSISVCNSIIVYNRFKVIQSGWIDFIILCKLSHLHIKSSYISMFCQNIKAIKCFKGLESYAGWKYGLFEWEMQGKMYVIYIVID